MTRSSTGPVRVLGLGNVLMGDDALGPYVVRLLQARLDLPESVQVVDLGTPGLDLVPHLSGAPAVIVVDTIRAEGEPGTIRLYRKEQLMAAPMGDRLSPHDPGLHQSLLTLELTDEGPEELLLIGMIPASTATGVGLSAAVHNAVDSVVAEVVRELERLGHQPSPSAHPTEPEIWWEHDQDCPSRQSRDP